MDDLRLRQRHRAFAHRSRQDRPLAVQRRRERQVGTRVGEPVRVCWANHPAASFAGSVLASARSPASVRIRSRSSAS